MNNCHGHHAIDLALGEVSPASMHDALAADPMLAVEVAEIRELFARFESLSCATSPRFHSLMAGVEGRAVARARQRISAGRTWPWLAAAAVMTLLALRAWHPLGAPGPGDHAAAVRSVAVGVAVDLLPRGTGSEPGPEGTPWLEPSPAQDPFLAVEARLANEGAERLLVNLASSAAFPRPQALHAWVAPGNLLALQRLDRELLASAEQRRQALSRIGANPDMDDRVQQLAAEVAHDLERELAVPSASVATVAASLRGLVHSGSVLPGAEHGAVLGRAFDWMLSRAEAGSCGSAIPIVLEALVEHAALTGSGLARVRALVQGFVADQLHDGRGRPLLADWKTAPAALAAAGRMLVAAPVFGVDPMACHVLRRLAWSHLRERESVLGSEPALLAAMAYGFADFTDAADGRLLGYRLASFLPDLAAVQHVVWSNPPGARGSTRVRLELRRLAALPTPTVLADRAHLLMSLSAEYASAGASLRGQSSG